MIWARAAVVAGLGLSVGFTILGATSYFLRFGLPPYGNRLVPLFGLWGMTVAVGGCVILLCTAVAFARGGHLKLWGVVGSVGSALAVVGLILGGVAESFVGCCI